MHGCADCADQNPFWHAVLVECDKEKLHLTCEGPSQVLQRLQAAASTGLQLGLLLQILPRVKTADGLLCTLYRESLTWQEAVFLAV